MAAQSVVAQSVIEQPTSDEAPESLAKQTIEIGAVTLMLPIEVDPKPYIRQILRIALESITHPKARECLEYGLLDAKTNEDFSSLIETFSIFRSEVNAERFFQSVEAVRQRSEVHSMNGDMNEEDA